MKIALAALAALFPLAASIAALAQTSTPATPAPAAATPAKPIPYSALKPKPKAPVAHKPAAAATGTPAPHASAPAATPSVAPTKPAPKPAAPTAAAPPPVRLSTATPLPPAELEAYLDGVVRDAMDREHIAGVTVAVVQNGQTVLKKGYGAASLSPVRKVDPDTTLFRVGSISKTFTWIALMREVDAGRIRIDAPVNLYLPERLQIRDQGFRAPILMVNLMDHSAGFEDRALGQLMERSADRERSLAEYLRQERPRRVHAPGAMSSYSNYGAALAGEAVTYVTGHPFERMIEDEIFTPLHLAHTTFREVRGARPGLPGPMPAALAADVSDGFRWTPAGFDKRPYEFIGHIAPAGAASSTAADMGRYMLALLNNGALDGVTIFGPGAAQAFRTPIRQTAPGINGWDHGFIEYPLPGGHKGFGHDGATLSFFSNMVVVPDLGLGVFISTNTESGAALAARLPAKVVGQFYATPAAAPRPGAPGLVENRWRYERHYIGTRRAYFDLEAIIGRIEAARTVRVTADGHLLLISRDQTTTWAPDGDPASGRFVSATGPGVLNFQLGENGRARSFVTGANGQVFEHAGVWDEPLVLLDLAILVGLTSIASLFGVATRNRREFRQTANQARASLVQNIQAVLWLVAFGLFGVWASGASDVAQLMYSWPGPWLVIAQGCAVVAGLMTLATVFYLPSVWRGGRRIDSWSAWRMAGFTATLLLSLTLSAMLWWWSPVRPFWPWAG